MEESSRKRSLDEIEEIENSSESEEENTATNSSDTPSLTKNKRVKQFSEIWDYFIKGAEKSHGYYKATCYYCLPKKSWAREKPAKLEAHLANECPTCPENISRYWQKKVAERKSNYIHRPLPKATINRLDQKITKTWIMVGIPFDVIKNPFIVNMFKEFLLAYNPPSKGTLLGRLLDEEVARINCAINKKIDKANHLTLEYLIGLKDYSSNSHTGEFLTNEISDIVEKLSSDKNVRCAVHAVNLIASNLVKLNNLKKLIVNCRKINNFFNSSHLSHSLLVKGFTDMKIKGDGLKVWLLSKHKESITNQEIANLIANEDFFTMCLNDNGFHKVALTAIEIWQSLGYTRSESNKLVALMRRFEAKIPPFNLPYVQAKILQKFGDCRTSLDINKLERMSKIKSYYMANIRHELNFFDVCNMFSVGKIMNYNEDQTDTNNEPSLEDMFNDSTILLIREICDLETEEISKSFAVNTVQAESLDNLDYNPCDVLNNFLEHEKQRS
ncbi:37927_t:CDS:2 [Gigaspora margarita]|uniref:37927_t:CDS:1 n=1 Tax=Gigaspora margarita TaxID=4874 RepID=A0ABN7V948_GIGMA|nr:37927_t:CDS:2 [Gigaspora margarita]